LEVRDGWKQNIQNYARHNIVTTPFPSLLSLKLFSNGEASRGFSKFAKGEPTGAKVRCGTLRSLARQKFPRMLHPRLKLSQALCVVQMNAGFPRSMEQIGVQMIHGTAGLDLNYTVSSILFPHLLHILLHIPKIMEHEMISSLYFPSILCSIRQLLKAGRIGVSDFS
jgi:hypothetical protein